jgi:hypothetical protein
MNEATDVKFMSVVKDACCKACIACSYSLVIFMVARFSAIYKQDLRASSEIQVIVMAIFLWNSFNTVRNTAFQLMCLVILDG